MIPNGKQPNFNSIFNQFISDVCLSVVKCILISQIPYSQYRFSEYENRIDPIFHLETSNFVHQLKRRILINFYISSGPTINYVVSKSAIFNPLPPLWRFFSTYRDDIHCTLLIWVSVGKKLNLHFMVLNCSLGHNN